MNIPELTLQIAAVAQEGDTLVFGMNRLLSDQEYEDLREQWMPMVENGIRVAIAEDVNSITVVKGTPPAVERTTGPRTAGDYALMHANGTSWADIIDMVRRERDGNGPVRREG